MSSADEVSNATNIPVSITDNNSDVITTVVNAIPPKIYEQTADVVLATFEKLVAPITATTEGFGKYIRQKFDTKVQVEQALFTYTLERAKQEAINRAAKKGLSIHPPESPKTFVDSLEEACKETDPLLHDMWVNLLASQLSDNECHPHFVKVLSHFSRAEALLMLSIFPISEIGENGGGYLATGDNSFDFWIPKNNEPAIPWTISCTLLRDFGFADVISPVGNPRGTTHLYRTFLGSKFLEATRP